MRACLLMLLLMAFPIAADEFLESQQEKLAEADYIFTGYLYGVPSPSENIKIGKGVATGALMGVVVDSSEKGGLRRMDEVYLHYPETWLVKEEGYAVFGRLRHDCIKIYADRRGGSYKVLPYPGNLVGGECEEGVIAAAAAKAGEKVVVKKGVALPKIGPIYFVAVAIIFLVIVAAMLVRRARKPKEAKPPEEKPPEEKPPEKPEEKPPEEKPPERPEKKDELEELFKEFSK